MALATARCREATSSRSCAAMPVAWYLRRVTDWLDLKGDLSIEIGGQTTKVELSQTQTTDLKTEDEDPTKKR